MAVCQRSIASFWFFKNIYCPNTEKLYKNINRNELFARNEKHRDIIRMNLQNKPVEKYDGLEQGTLKKFPLKNRRR